MLLESSVSQQRSYRNYHLIGHLFFITVLVYGIVYAIERVTYVDSAWQFFLRANDETFIFPSNRYGVVFSQLPLFISTKLHVPFKLLIYIFSVSYILLYYFVWWLCSFKLRNGAAGLAIVFCMFMGMREGFIHPVTETQQCLMFSVLLYAIMQYPIQKSFLKYTLAMLCAVLILVTHPVGLFTAGFSVLLSMTESKNFKSVYHWSVLGVLIGFSLYRFFVPIDNYDAAIYDQLKSTGIAQRSFLDSGALHFLKIHFPHFYWLPELAGGIALIWLLLQRQFLKAGLLFFCVISYITIAVVTFRDGDSSILLERAFLPAFFMINLVIGGLIVNEIKINKWIPLVLTVFFIVNGIRFINAGCLMYKKRVAYLDELVQKGIQQGHDKYYILETNADMEKILVPWALGTETLIYSKFKYDTCISITLNNETCSPADVRVTKTQCVPVDDLNPHYFHLSKNEYTELK